MSETAEEVEKTEVTSSSAEDMLEMILMKEDEVKQRVQRAENEAQRMVEEAKLDAAHVKRESVNEDIGAEIREKELAKAAVEAEKVKRDCEAEAAEMRKKGMERVDEAIRIVLEGVLPPRD
jgi:vacuolar-type H+-ATPase subunit H